MPGSGQRDADRGEHRGPQQPQIGGSARGGGGRGSHGGRHHPTALIHRLRQGFTKYGTTPLTGAPTGAPAASARARDGAHAAPRLHLCAHLPHPPNERYHVPDMLTDLAARQ
ncbi:hypothetical protein GCM10010211_54830 [Streptomyces albospinus]|uniref:Uncharacterized protein n=1 Tax=Streptomyces albospinus TaxID=285515 RepID=A0ABQ2VDN9_9ACTN|nr:hypothetical protein GCM10010211_54830 [Streptomyces albospinus]